jgi:hypothetical protein
MLVLFMACALHIHTGDLWQVIYFRALVHMRYMYNTGITVQEKGRSARKAARKWEEKLVGKMEEDEKRNKVFNPNNLAKASIRLEKWE